MADRSIVVHLRANVEDFRRQLGSAEASLSRFEKSVGGTEKVSTTSMGRLAQSLQVQSSAWDQVSSRMTKHGLILTGILGIVGKTGISYNTLQQTSRAALTTLTGSAEAAARQMDRLDAFARTSPFAKDVFIRAQQQMLAFGIEARKVIPYLDAIQNAVAASGGSNHDIAEIVRIMSQIQSAAKITAVDLMQFGQRGIDAAALIGLSMGKTGSQIRREITKGTLDAREALDALAKGMAMKFDGASANVKNTMAGAFDRVKAAFRDLASDLTRPLVDPNGGGFLVGITNGLADFLRMLGSAPPVLKSTMGVLAAAGAATLVLTGALIKGTQAAIAYRSAIAAISTANPKIGGFLSVVGKIPKYLGIAGIAVSAVSAAWSLFSKQQGDAKARAEALSEAIDGQTGRLKDSARQVALNNLEKDLKVNFDALSKLGIDRAMVIDAYLNNTGDAWGKLRDKVKETRLELEQNLGKTAPFPQTLGQLDALEHALESAGKGSADYAKSLEIAKSVSESTTDKTLTLADALKGISDTQMGATKDLHAFITAMDSAGKGFVDFKKGIDDAKLSLNQWLDGLTKQIEAKANFQRNMAELARFGIDKGFLKEVAALGPAGQLRMQQMMDQVTSGAGEQLKEQTAKIAEGANRTFSETFGKGLDSTIQIDADTSVASMQLNNLKLEVDQTTGIVKLDGNPIPAQATLGQLVGNIDKATGTVRINGEKFPADQTVRQFLQDTSRQTGLVRVDADTDPARRAVASLGGMIASLAARASSIRIGGGLGSVTMASGGMVSQYGFAGGGSPRARFPLGGLVKGPGTGTSDSVPAWISRGEFVMREAAVSKYGPGLMHAINGLRFANGGSPSMQMAPLLNHGPVRAGGLSDGDIERIADAIRAGSEQGTRAGFQGEVAAVGREVRAGVI